MCVADQNPDSLVLGKPFGAERARSNLISRYSGLDQCVPDDADSEVAEILTAHFGAERIQGAIDSNLERRIFVDICFDCCQLVQLGRRKIDSIEIEPELG